MPLIAAAAAAQPPAESATVKALEAQLAAKDKELEAAKQESLDSFKGQLQDMSSRLTATEGALLRP